MALATRDRSSLDAAADALEKATKAVPGNAMVWTARAEVALARQDFDQARQAGAKAAELRDPSGLRAVGVARLLDDQDPADGARIYFEGLVASDEAGLYRYHEDLAPLLLLEEEVEWTVLAPTERANWLRNAWEWRASTSGRTVADRLALHFNRLGMAADRYRRMAHYGARPDEAIVRDSFQLRLPLDDRGLIYVRHGEPDDVVREAGGRTGPGREAWIYFGLNGGRALFEFRKLPGWGDWLLSSPGECDPFVYMYGEGGVNGERRYLAREPAHIGWEAEFERGVLDWGNRVAPGDPALAANTARCYSIVHQTALADPILGEGLRRAGGTPPGSAANSRTSA
jgi:hypothetical protein